MATYKRYLVEFDTGVDLHGMDYTKAAKKAVKNAISHCCLCSMQDLLNLENPADAMRVSIKIGCPDPAAVRKEEVLEQIPFGNPEIEVVHGGLAGKGLCVPTLGNGDTIVMVNALLTVWVDTEQVSL